MVSRIYQLSSRASGPGAKRRPCLIKPAVLAAAGLLFSAEMTADLQPPLISFVWIAKWWQAGEEEAGLLAEVAGVSRCCLMKLPGAASQKRGAWGRKTHHSQL